MHARPPRRLLRIAPRWWRRGIVGRALFVFGSGLLLGACTPTFDWRELQPADAPMIFMLPARPSDMQRQVGLAGHDLPMRMFGARAAEQIFTAAWVDLHGHEGPGEDGVRAAVLEAMVQGMLRNIGATDQRDSKVELVAISQHDGSKRMVLARQVIASGNVDGRPMQMRALFAMLPAQAHQFVVMGADINDEAAQMFFDSIRLVVLPASGG
ncbi:MAG: hypothetical protein R3E87_19105 [Burkholderiaceae bacterium]